MRKILYISGTRADYGLMRKTLFQIKNHPNLNIEIVATGMHLMPKFGWTVKDIKKDGFKAIELKAVYKKDNKESMVEFIGNLVKLLSKAIKKIKPDIILLLGDRGEMLAGAIAGAYLTIPVAHIHGGDITSTVDEITRGAITKLSHIHFLATKKSAERIIKMNEEPWRIFIVGAPGLDSILNEKLYPKEQMVKKYNLSPLKPILIVLQHPVTGEIENTCFQRMKETMEAIKNLGLQTIVIYPNADAGGRKMIEVIEKYRQYPFIQIYKNLPHIEYLSLMKIANVIIGNSSSGIIEAPSFHLPAVNIGEREKGRERVSNVIDVNYNRKEIEKAIKKAINDKAFIKKLKKIKNIYGDGKASLKICRILNKIKINDKLLKK